MKRAIIMVLTLALVLSVLVCPVSYAEEAGERCYSLVEAGSFSDPMGEVVFNRGFVSRKDGDITVMLNNMGEKVTDYPVLGAEYLGAGLYVVWAQTGAEMNTAGLVSSEGEILIPFDAALIEWPDNGDNGRFVSVSYVTEETENKEECYLYTYQGINPYDPSDGEAMYKGYSRVYDRIDKCFVESVEDGHFALSSCGNSFVVESYDEDVYRVFNSAGALVLESESAVRVGDGIYSVYNEGKPLVYDDTGAQTYASGKGFWLKGKYLVEDRDNGSAVRNSKGEIVLECEGSVSEENQGILKLYEDGKYALINENGQVLQEFKKDTYVEYLGYGIYRVERKDKENLIDKNGLIAQDVEGDQRNLLVHDDNKILVLNKGEYSPALEADQVTLLQPALVAAYSDDNACYGVFDLFTGEQLLPYEYHAIEVSGNYLYAYKGGEYSVYELIAPEY